MGHPCSGPGRVSNGACSETTLFMCMALQEYMDNLIVETLTLNEEESLAAEVKILDSMSEDSMPDNIVRSKVRGSHCGINRLDWGFGGGGGAG